MAAGPLRDRVRFERRAQVSDGAGNYVSDWQTLDMDRWAQVKPLRGGENVIAAKLQSTGIYEIKVRSDSETRTVTADDRVVDISSGQAYNIRLVENRDMRNRYLTLTCERGVADG